MKPSSIFANVNIGDAPDRDAKIRRLEDYIRRRGFREHPVLTRCRQETDEMGGIALMQVAPDQGALLGFLARLIGAKTILEIGVFTGYSSLAMALGMEEAIITACDMSEEFTDKAKLYWEAAGVSDRIELRLAPALETLTALLSEGREGQYDMAFIDADKSNYDAYYEKTLQLLRRGGLIALDNVLWGGQVADHSDQSADTAALRRLNEKIHGDSRVEMILLPIADGLTLCQKK